MEGRGKGSVYQAPAISHLDASCGATREFTISPFNFHKFTNAQASQANNPSPAVRRLAQIPRYLRRRLTVADASQSPTPFNSIIETTDLSTRRHDPSHGRASVLPLPITSVDHTLDHTQSTANHHLDFEIHPSRTAGFPIPCSAVALGFSLSSPSSIPAMAASASTYLVLSPLTNKY
ncbi:hypothetical protein M0R45_001963 [Rubus argutus]|uniref:Uncharacterized protein n=1 Tax=Rubus argutus TaxID=59490 RepID=A0AAW1VJZ6_RUBAR